MEKRLVNTVNMEKICISKCSKDQYFLVVIWRGVLAFVSREKFNEGDFYVKSFKGVTNGNGYDKLRHEDLRLLLNKLLSDGCEVYVYDSLEEFLVGASNHLDR